MSVVGHDQHVVQQPDVLAPRDRPAVVETAYPVLAHVHVLLRERVLLKIHALERRDRVGLAVLDGLLPEGAELSLQLELLREPVARLCLVEDELRPDEAADPVEGPDDQPEVCRTVRDEDAGK